MDTESTVLYCPEQVGRHRAFRTLRTPAQLVRPRNTKRAAALLLQHAPARPPLVRQIVVPPGLQDVLKEYAKAAIKAQPSDLVAWSAT